MSVTGRTPTTTLPPATALARQSAMNVGGVIGQSASCNTNGSPDACTPTHSVPMSTGVTPASPSAQTAVVTSASPWISANGRLPRPSSTTVPRAGGASYGSDVMADSP